MYSMRGSDHDGDDGFALHHRLLDQARRGLPHHFFLPVHLAAQLHGVSLLWDHFPQVTPQHLRARRM